MLVRKPNCTELKPRFFPKTEPKPIDLGQRETVTTLLSTASKLQIISWNIIGVSSECNHEWFKGYKTVDTTH